MIFTLHYISLILLFKVLLSEILFIKGGSLLQGNASCILKINWKSLQIIYYASWEKINFIIFKLKSFTLLTFFESFQITESGNFQRKRMLNRNANLPNCLNWNYSKKILSVFNIHHVWLPLTTKKKKECFRFTCRKVQY